ncbi:hypothetical protein SLS60_005583 [Paraconiothyrium brasiliense]|uniref:Uncharacterized protein n=1 Tax=Paraconiothyrium brasiliense TaxID=300254 RepID=A0ABR3RHS4_9PLEO
MSGRVSSGAYGGDEQMQDTGIMKQVQVSLKVLQNRADLKEMMLAQDSDLYPAQIAIDDESNIYVDTKDLFELRGSDRPSFRARDPCYSCRAIPKIIRLASDMGPCNPPGLVVPNLPYDLASEEQENAPWAQIVKDDPDMESVGNAVKASNSSRREATLDPYRTRVEQSLQEWRDCRGGIAGWICRLPLGEDPVAHGLDWARLWRLFSPDTTPMPGIQNRARIWKDCARILDHNVRLREQGPMDGKREVVREVISYNKEQWWHHAIEGRHDPDHNGFLRRSWQNN